MHQHSTKMSATKRKKHLNPFLNNCQGYFSYLFLLILVCLLLEKACIQDIKILDWTKLKTFADNKFKDVA